MTLMCSMKVPTLTHLQYAVLSKLETKRWLKTEDIFGDEPRLEPRIMPKLYSLLHRTESDHFIEGRYRTVEGPRGKVRVREYRLTEAGKAARDQSRAFYSMNHRKK